jgi:surfeit locus 1 family protein
MRFGGMEFRPGRWPTLITLAVFVGLLSLGFWQLDRAAQKRSILADYRAGTSTALLKLDAGVRSIEGLQYQSASATGRYDAVHQFLLDNRTYNGAAGYEVLTPLKLAGAGVGVLVNRGWIPLGGSRDQLPEMPVDSNERTVIGRIREVSQKGFSLGEEEKRTGWPYRVLRADIPHLASELGYPLLPLELLLDPGQPDGYVRDWHPMTFGPERNVGYAVQWFAMAATLMVIYLAVNLEKREVHDDTDE